MSKLTQTIHRFKENMKQTGSFAIAIPSFYYHLFFYPGNDISNLILLGPRIIAVLVSPLSIILSVGASGLAACASIALTLFLPLQCAYAKIYDACEPIDDVSFDTFETTETTDTNTTGIDNTTATSHQQTGTGEQPPIHHSSPLASGKSSPSSHSPAKPIDAAKPATEPGRAPAPGGI